METPEGTSFNAISLEQTLVDKMTALASPMWRIKDFVDIYRISLLSGIYIPNVDRLLKEELVFNEFMNRMDDFKYTYTKYCSDMALPAFEEAYARVYSFVSPWVGPMVRFSSDRFYRWEGNWVHVQR